MEADGKVSNKVPIFDGKGDFQIWKTNIKDILIRDGLYKVVMNKRPEKMKDEEWEEMEHRATSTIRLGLSPDIKHQLLEISNTAKIWEKLETIYASKSLTNQLTIRIELYQLKMSEGDDLHNHICKFETLVCRLKSTGDKLEEIDQALLLLASLPDSYRALRQTMLLTGRGIKYDDVLAILRDNELMKPKETLEGGVNVIQGKRQPNPSRQKDFSKVECYHCRMKGHTRRFCPKFEEEVRKFMASQKNEQAQTNIVYSDVIMAIKEGAGKEDWVMDSGASSHICRDKEMFDTLTMRDDLGDFTVGNGEKVKAEGVGRVKLRLRNGEVKTLRNVKYVPTFGTNVISLGEVASLGYTCVSNKWSCKVFREKKLVLLGKMTEKNIYILKGRAVGGGCPPGNKEKKGEMSEICSMGELPPIK